MQSGRPRVIILQANKFFFEKGGSERYMFALCDALTGRGHELLHFSMAHPDNRPSQRVAEKIGLRLEKRSLVHGGREAVIYAGSL